MNASSSANTGLFHAGDRWLAIGDSITQHAGYQAAVLLYYATRLPDRPLEPANAGIVGDSAGGALNRYEWDIAPHRATVATVLFGMNDVGQGLYDAEAPTPERLDKRRAALADYAQNVARLADRLRRDGARVILISPSIFDETTQSDRPTRPGINSALAECGVILHRLAATHGHAFIDLHTPMAALNARLQAANPSASVIGPDRIHPGSLGHLLMAYHLLKAQSAPSLVSRIDLDAASGRVRATENAAVKDVVASPGTAAFTVEARALPYPIFDDAKAVLAWIPFHDDLNQEILRVTGLAPGLHALFVDGVEVRRYTAEELAAGVNFALESATPQMRQASVVGGLIEQWRQLLSLKLRRIALVEYWHLRDLPRPVDFEAARRLLHEKLASVKDLDAYTRTALESYLTAKPVEQNTERELAALRSRIEAESRPRPHAYRLKHLPSRQV